jgi:hypothetical protein
MMNPTITQEPNSVKGWYCRSKDGAFGFGKSADEARQTWAQMQRRKSEEQKAAKAKKSHRLLVAGLWAFLAVEFAFALWTGAHLDK